MKQCLLLAVLLCSVSSFAQQWQEVDASQITITDSSGYYLFKDISGNPLTGGYNIYAPASRLKVQLHGGLIHGVYWEFDELDRPLLQCQFHQGVYHGRQLTFYKNKSKIREQQEYCYGTQHGEFIRFDSTGNVVQSWYFLNGYELGSKAEYLERSKNISCQQPVAISSSGLFITEDLMDFINAYELMDTIWVKDEVTLMKQVFEYPVLMNCNIDQDLHITVLSSNEWNLESYIPVFKPGKYEMVLFCGIIKGEHKRQVHFALGNELRQAFMKEKCYTDMLLDYLEYDVFGSAGFPTELARYALEKAINNEDPLTRQ